MPSENEKEKIEHFSIGGDPGNNTGFLYHGDGNWSAMVERGDGERFMAPSQRAPIPADLVENLPKTGGALVFQSGVGSHFRAQGGLWRPLSEEVDDRIQTQILLKPVGALFCAQPPEGGPPVYLEKAANGVLRPVTDQKRLEFAKSMNGLGNSNHPLGNPLGDRVVTKLDLGTRYASRTMDIPSSLIIRPGAGMAAPDTREVGTAPVNRPGPIALPQRDDEKETVIQNLFSMFQDLLSNLFSGLQKPIAPAVAGAAAAISDVPSPTEPTQQVNTENIPTPQQQTVAQRPSLSQPQPEYTPQTVTPPTPEAEHVNPVDLSKARKIAFKNLPPSGPLNPRRPGDINQFYNKETGTFTIPAGADWGGTQVNITPVEGRPDLVNLRFNTGGTVASPNQTHFETYITKEEFSNTTFKASGTGEINFNFAGGNFNTERASDITFRWDNLNPAVHTNFRNLNERKYGIKVVANDVSDYGQNALAGARFKADNENKREAQQTMKELQQERRRTAYGAAGEALAQAKTDAAEEFARRMGSATNRRERAAARNEYMAELAELQQGQKALNLAISGKPIKLAGVGFNPQGQQYNPYGGYSGTLPGGTNGGRGSFRKE